MKKEMARISRKRIIKRILDCENLVTRKVALSTIKMVKSKLEKASAAHAGQAKALGKVIDKKKLLVRWFIN